MEAIIEVQVKRENAENVEKYDNRSAITLNV